MQAIKLVFEKYYPMVRLETIPIHVLNVENITMDSSAFAYPSWLVWVIYGGIAVALIGIGVEIGVMFN